MYKYFEFTPTDKLINETIKEINIIVESGLDKHEEQLIQRELRILTRNIILQFSQFATELNNQVNKAR